MAIISYPFITTITNVSADLTTAQLVDLTTYGGSSPDRDELALYAYLYKRTADLTDTQISLDNTSPLTVNAWSFALAANDGWYVAVIFGFPIWSAGTFNLNECVYHDGVYYVANTTTTEEPGTGGDWDVISDILAEVLNLDDSGVYITTTNNFSTDRSGAGPVGDALADLGPDIKAGKCKDWAQAADVITGGALIQSAWANFRRADYQEAQEIIDYVQQNYAA
jgi:hypothetical protein